MTSRLSSAFYHLFLSNCAQNPQLTYWLDCYGYQRQKQKGDGDDGAPQTNTYAYGPLEAMLRCVGRASFNNSCQQAWRWPVALHTYAIHSNIYSGWSAMRFVSNNVSPHLQNFDMRSINECMFEFSTDLDGRLFMRALSSYTEFYFFILAALSWEQSRRER